MSAFSRTKILYLITKSNWGGAQRYVFDIASHLDPEKFEVVVVTGGAGRLIDELTQKGIRVRVTQNLQRDISLFKELLSLRELYTIIAEERPDILHINSSKAGILGACIGRICRVPRILFTAHGWAFNEERPLWQKLCITILHWVTVLLSHTTIAVSHTIKHQMSLPFVKHKMVVIHNGRTLSDVFSRETARAYITQCIPEIAKYHNDFWSVTIGELHPVKQHDVTIRAFAEIVQSHPEARHIFIGTGSEEAHLKELVQKLSLQKNVFFAGHIHEASQYLSAFDLFILASRSEAFAYVLIEASAAGLPIIASDVGGIPEIIEHTVNGMLFPSGNHTLLAKHTISLIENTNLRQTLGEHAKTHSLRFTFEKMFSGTLALYENIF